MDCFDVVFIGTVIKSKCVYVYVCVCTRMCTRKRENVGGALLDVML